MWKNGFAIRYRSPGRRSAQSHQSRYARNVWPCVITTPFGLPVVPDVNTTSLGSSGPRDATRASRSATVTDAPDEVAQRDGRSVGLAPEQDRLFERGQSGVRAREQRRIVGIQESAHGEE